MSASIHHAREVVSSYLASIPVSTCEEVPQNEVIEIPADLSIGEAVELLANYDIFSAPVRNPNAGTEENWHERYIGILDYGAVILWVLEQAEVSALALAVGSATAAGVGAGALGALGALAVGATGPAAVVGLTVAAVGAAVTGGIAVSKGISKDAPSAVDALGEDFYKVILREEPFISIKVADVAKSYWWTPFLPVTQDDSMLTLLVLLSTYQLRSIPVVDLERPQVKNFITQSAVVRELIQCKGRDWFDKIASQMIKHLTFPVMHPNQVVTIDGKKLILEAFICMKEKKIDGLPVIDSESRKIIGNISIRDVRHLLLKRELFAKHKALTVADFMEILHSRRLVKHMTPAITCTQDATLGDIINLMCINRIHRIYVVDTAYQVVGVITLCDVISCFIVEPPDFADKYFNGIFKSVLVGHASSVI